MTDRVRELLAALACGDAACICATTLTDGEGMTHCPAHADNSPSLNVTRGDERLLLHCFAKCPQSRVIGALRSRDLWTRETAYDYLDADGTLLFQAVRRETPGELKKFVQRRPDGAGGWVYSTKGTRRVLYRFPELLASSSDELVFVVEGEKDADRLASLDLVATTNVGGAGERKWLTSYSPEFTQRDVVVLGDNDDSGRQHRDEVVRGILPYAARVRCVDLPGLPDKGDVSDWLDQGHLLAELLELVQRAPTVTTQPSDVDDADDDVQIELAEVPSFPVGALPAAMRGIVDGSGLPTTLLAGGMLGAVMAAAGDQVEVSVHQQWSERLHDYIVLLAPRNAGKSPSLDQAYGAINRHDADASRRFRDEDATWKSLKPTERRGERKPINDAILRGAFTFEALSRRLGECACVPVMVDEMRASLSDLGRYHEGGAGGDIGHLLALWSGGAWRVMRVAGGEAHNALDLYVERPTVSVVGGLQTAFHTLLGADEDGLRPRWLIHLTSEFPRAIRFPSAEQQLAYDELIERLIRDRAQPRRWLLLDDVLEVFETMAADWRRRASQPDVTSATSAMLGKANRHALRIAGAIAEASATTTPSGDVRLPRTALEAARLWTEFCIACTAAVPSGAPLALSQREERIDAVIARVVAYLDEHGGELPARHLRMYRVGGISSQDALDAVLERYAAQFPGSVEVVKTGGRGRPSTVVRSPKRKKVGTGNFVDSTKFTIPPAFFSAFADEASENEIGHDESETESEEPKTLLNEIPETVDENPELLNEIPQQTSFVDAPSKPKPVKPKAAKPSALPPYPTPSIMVVDDPDQLEDLAALLLSSQWVGLDIETTALHPVDGRIRTVQFAIDDQVFIVDAFKVATDAFRTALEPAFSNRAAACFVLHNAPFDLSWLTSVGLSMPPLGRVFDTQTAAFLLESRGSIPKDSQDKRPPRKWDLRSVVARYLAQDLPKDLQQSGWDAESLTDGQLAYAARDAHATAALGVVLARQLAEADLNQVMTFEMKTLPAIVELCSSGVAIDVEGWRRLGDALNREADQLLVTTLIEPYGPRDVSEDQQRAFWRSNAKKLALLQSLGIDAKKTNEEYLLSLGSEHPIIPALIAWQKAAHTARTYGEAYLRGHLASDGRLYAGWRLLGQDTGRMACLTPNLQNIPRDPRFRRLVVATEGKVFVKADYAALQILIAAELAQETNMIRALNHGVDIHRLTAAAVHKLKRLDEVTREQRQGAKAINFGFLFGAFERRFIDSTFAREGVKYSMQDAMRFRGAFFRTYPALERWHARYDWDSAITITCANTGRRRVKVTSKNEKINTPVVNLEVAGFKTALQGLLHTRAECPSARLVMLVHDEVVVEVDRDQAVTAAAWLEREMAAAMQALLPSVPVKVETTICRDYAGTPAKEEDRLAA